MQQASRCRSKRWRPAKRRIPCCSGAVGGVEVGYPARQPAPGRRDCSAPQRAGAVCEACGLSKIFEPLKSASPIKDSIIGDQLDILVVRELTGGIYFGERGRYEKNGAPAAYDTESYSVPEIERIARVAFDMAMKRGKKLTSVDKANVLESSRLWRETVVRVSAEYPEVELNHMYVDNCAMQLVRNPGQFDVIVTSNMFGDILSDEAP